MLPCDNFMVSTNYSYLIKIIFFHTRIWFKEFQSKASNLTLLWFKVFLSNTNNLYTIVCFQVYPCNNNNWSAMIWFQISLMLIICTKYYGFKYSYLILLICTQLYGLKYFKQLCFKVPNNDYMIFVWIRGNLMVIKKRSVDIDYWNFTNVNDSTQQKWYISVIPRFWMIKKWHSLRM